MRIKKIKVRGYGRFHKEQVIDLDQMDGARLVAVMGDNGAGKTTFMETVPGALYRSTPSHGHIAYLATAKDTLVELDIETDKEYKAQLQIDGLLKVPKVVSYLFEGDKPLNDGKASTYGRVIDEVFPSKEALLSAAFAAQNGEGRFLSLQPVERKELFAKMLGLGKLEELSKMAGEHARSAKEQVSELRARLAAYAEIAGSKNDLERLVDEAERAYATICDRLATERIKKEEHEKSVAIWDATKIELQRTAEQYEHRYNIALTEFKHSVRQVKELDVRISEAQSNLEELLSRAERRDELLEKEKHLEKYVSNLMMYEKKHEELTSSMREYNQSIMRLNHIRRRIEDASEVAGGLEDVPCKGEGAYSGCPLIASAIEAGSLIAELREQYEETEHNLDPNPPSSSDIERSKKQLEVYQDIVREARNAAAQVKALETVDKDIKRESDVLSELLTRRDDIMAQSTASDLDEAKRESDMHLTALAEHQKCPPPLCVTTFGRDEAREKEARRELSRLVAKLEEATVASEKGHEITIQLNAACQDLDGWKTLQNALGKNGIQALEIDAAGPDVSSLANELMHFCYGSRFSLSLETTALKRAGGTKEVFDLRVIDTERGTDGDASHLSGGEQVLVTEALSLAIAIYNTRRSNKPMYDLWRDECSGALSGENARRYIEMLRKAIDLGGFHRCYFVAHQPALWEMADKRLEFSGGKAEVM